MPMFFSNYPAFKYGQRTLMPTPTRTDANPDFTGRGVVMAFLDSGFYPHPDIADRIRLHVDATTQQIEETDTYVPITPFSWHGQMTSVIAGSNGSFQGIARNAEYVLIKISDSKGRVKEPDILRGLHWLVENHHTWHIRVVNISVGGDYVNHDPDHAIYKSIRALVDEGVTVVVAAGNNPNAKPVPPASAVEAITVGGYDDNNTLERAYWTAYHHTFGKDYAGNPKPDILAPAVWIPSPIMPETEVAREAQWLGKLLYVRDTTSVRRLLMDGWDDLGIHRQQATRPTIELYQDLQQRIYNHKLVDAEHQYVDGTSVATPIVTSVVAQLLEANPNLTPQQIRTILTQTADHLPQIPREKQGAGVLNAAAAVKLALES